MLSSHDSACLLSSGKNLVIICLRILMRNANLLWFAFLLSICVHLNSCLEAQQMNDQAKSLSGEERQRPFWDNASSSLSRSRVFREGARKWQHSNRSCHGEQS